MTCNHHEYDVFLERFNYQFLNRVRDNDNALFTTAVNPKHLWRAYINSFPASQRQYHNCHACREFITGYGGLVVISQGTGKIQSALWRPVLNTAAYALYSRGFAAMRALVESSYITGCFGYGAEDGQLMGRAATPEWSHLAVNFPPGAQPTEMHSVGIGNYRMLERAFDAFPVGVCDTALQLLSSPAAYREEKVIDRLRWFRNLPRPVRRIPGLSSPALWKYIHKAPTAWCAINGSVLGMLMSDLMTKSKAQALDNFNRAMDPLRYMRPTAAPKEGTINQAEKKFRELGLELALPRRFATMADIPDRAFDWKPSLVNPGGVFSHLRRTAPAGATLAAPPKMSMAKFRRLFLADAAAIDYQVADGAAYFALVTAVNPLAPLLFQWPHPVSWYTYSGIFDQDAKSWGLSTGVWEPVHGIIKLPAHWDGGISRFSPMSMFLLSAMDRKNGGSGLFPEILRKELHDVRSVIEAFSKSAVIQRPDNAVSAVVMAEHVHTSLRLRVTTHSGDVYTTAIDRDE